VKTQKVDFLILRRVCQNCKRAQLVNFLEFPIFVGRRLLSLHNFSLKLQSHFKEFCSGIGVSVLNLLRYTTGLWMLLLIIILSHMILQMGPGPREDNTSGT